MADNTVSNSDSSWEGRVHEGPINPTDDAKRLRANLTIHEEARIARERKLQTNPAVKTAIKSTSSANK